MARTAIQRVGRVWTARRRGQRAAAPAVEAEHDAELAQVVVARSVEIGATHARHAHGASVLAQAEPAQHASHVLGSERVERTAWA